MNAYNDDENFAGIIIIDQSFYSLQNTHNDCLPVKLNVTIFS